MYVDKLQLLNCPSKNAAIFRKKIFHSLLGIGQLVLVPIVKGVASKSSHNNMNDTIVLQIWRLYEAGLRQIPYLDNKFHYQKCYSNPKIETTQNLSFHKRP